MEQNKYITVAMIGILFAIIAAGTTGTDFISALASSFSKPVFLAILALLVAMPRFLEKYSVVVQIIVTASLILLLLSVK